MTVKISQTADIQKFFEEASGALNDQGNPRVKSLVLRILQDNLHRIFRRRNCNLPPDVFG